MPFTVGSPKPQNNLGFINISPKTKPPLALSTPSLLKPGERYSVRSFRKEVLAVYRMSLSTRQVTQALNRSLPDVLGLIIFFLD